MVSNIADAEAVEKMRVEEEEQRRRELNDIRTLLSNQSGRRFMWRLLEHCNTFNSVYSADQSIMSYQAGKQDLGHFLMSEITQADENLLIKLMKDNRKEV